MTNLDSQNAVQAARTEVLGIEASVTLGWGGGVAALPSVRFHTGTAYTQDKTGEPSHEHSGENKQ